MSRLCDIPRFRNFTFRNLLSGNTIKAPRILALFLLFAAASPLTAQENQAAAISLAKDLNVLLVLISAALVFLMQMGFLFLETGLVRAKNSINVAIKNLIDFVLGFLMFFLVGYGLMFGASQAGWIGWNFFMLEGLNTSKEFALFVFQVTFMGTAATIVSGAVAERMRFPAYLFVSIFVSTLIYPVFGHWVWGGGWLAQLGFMDFAGSTVVHSVGGWIALAGVIVLGPRLGKYGDDGRPQHIAGHNMPLAVAGTLILWFGWFGFNGGSALSLSNPNFNVAKIIANTCVAAAAGGTMAMVTSWFWRKIPMVEDIVNGILGGLVAVTAGCAYFGPSSAFLVGCLAGPMVIFVIIFLEKILRIDDVVGAYAVHAACGILGTLLLPFLANPKYFGKGITMWDQFYIQALGVAVCAAWSFGMGLVLFLILKFTIRLRVDPDQEKMGLNIAEHGARTAWLDLMNSLQDLARGKGDLRTELPVEYGTEAGQTAELFNEVRATLNRIISDVKMNARQMAGAADHLNLEAQKIARDASSQSADTENTSVTLMQITESISQGARNAEKTRDLAETTAHDAREGGAAVTETVKAMQRIMSTIEVIEDIAATTNMLSLNASIEATRAGEAGKGFAVVAGEIRKLAMRARSAAREVDEVARSGVVIAEKAGGSFEKILSGIQDTAALIREIARASGEQNQGVSEINQAVVELDRIAANTASSSNRLSDTAREMREKTQQLERVMSLFKVDEPEDDRDVLPPIDTPALPA